MPDNTARRRDSWRLAARAAGYRSRAAFKLLELNSRHKLLRRGMRVLDLGASPGSWSQIAAREVGPAGQVIAVDKRLIPPMDGVQAVQLDMAAPDVLQQLHLLLPGPADLVLSDMAPDLTGVAPTDQQAATELVLIAAAVAREMLAPRGRFVCKMFQGEDFPALCRQLKQTFDKMKFHNLQASRSNSRETFCVAMRAAGQ